MAELGEVLKAYLMGLIYAAWAKFTAALKRGKWIVTDKATGKVYCGFPLGNGPEEFGDGLAAFVRALVKQAKTAAKA
jgi:hypothetical protein